MHEAQGGDIIALANFQGRISNRMNDENRLTTGKGKKIQFRDILKVIIEIKDM
jgi:hypothetical protein